MEQQENNSPITLEHLFQKVCELQTYLEKPKVEKGLWEIKDIANYCGLSYNHTYTHIVTDPKFPAPVDLPCKTGSKKSKARFLREEVILFFEKNKKKKHRT